MQFGFSAGVTVMREKIVWIEKSIFSMSTFEKRTTNGEFVGRSLVITLVVGVQ